MQLAELKLQHFRCYPKRIFTFSKNTTVFVGANAIGKTNILEAIFMLAVGKSFRASGDSETVKNGEEIGRVTAFICHPDQAQRVEGSRSDVRPRMREGFLDYARNDKEGDQIKLELMLTRGFYQGQKIPIKKYLVNGVSRRMVDFVGNLKVVLFEPEDIELVRGSPSKKRNYLDFILVQVDREYRRSLSAYEKGVRQRNRLLEQIRDEGARESQLLFWDELIIKNGSYLTEARQSLITFLNGSSKPFGEFTITYDHSFISQERLEKYHQAEIASATTLVGPHRDNFLVFEDGRNIAQFGSRGEQRLAVLWLKLSERTFIEKKTGEQPLLLLDDIFSELDIDHRGEVLAIINGQQTLMTTTDKHFIPEEIKDLEVVELE